MGLLSVIKHDWLQRAFTNMRALTMVRHSALLSSRPPYVLCYHMPILPGGL